MFRSIGLIVIAVVLATGCNTNPPSSTPKPGTLQGVVSGPTGPIGGASIVVTPTDNSYHTGTADANGFYQITGIPAGSIVYTVSAPGFQTYTGSATINPDAATVQNVSLSNG
ncbi:MAG: carboxypeptidase regulatory-like domain-containing protein [Candidatus Eremiobacteraeota bacterium]|nr:carboxypeptidase regulatory-like domain-containing protein [Candidatus Eremiobacteraeota bacterium]MBV8365957.1 carboxypeptidase regulatory-like domain-containing protein [Candidatus Eremiobacteraeota bacterium]